MSGAEPRRSAPAEEMASWALACLARGDASPPPAPPAHERLDHLAQALGIGSEGQRMVALFYGLWCGSGQVPPVSAAQARRASGSVGAHLRGLLVQWEVLAEVAVAPGAPLALVLDETIGDWLEGGEPIPPRWRDRISARAAPRPLPGWPVAALVDRARRALRDGPHPLVLRLAGPEGAGRRSLAACVAQALGTTPIFADLRGLDRDEALALIRITERAARLTLRPPAWIGGAGLQLPAAHPGFALQFDIADRDGRGLLRDGADLHRSDLDALSLDDRAEAWDRLVPGFGDWPDGERAALVRLKPATIGEIARIGAQAPTDADGARGLLRLAQCARLDPAITPRRGRLGWDDLILPERLTTALRRLGDEIALGPALWQSGGMDRLFPQGRGIFALFSGPSGTGKTMAAQVIAHALGLDLYVVDSGAITSKFVGETAQNLQNVLAQAQSDAALLFFDEADGLFGKRTETRDAHARYLNADTNVLLQAVEGYTGACILATNRRDNVDAAFLRRLRYALEFPRPDSGLRLRLWRVLVAELSPDSAETMTPACARLAETLEFTGAQIKNALRTAMIEAHRDGRAALTAQDLLAGADHELMKEGRALTPAETARLRGPHG